MGIFDMFSPQPTAAPTTPVAATTPGAPPTTPVVGPATPAPGAIELKPANPGNIPDNAGAAQTNTANTEPNGIIPAGAADGGGINSPLAEFEKMWEPIDTKGQPNGAPVTLDPAKLQEVIGKASFTQAVTSENIAKITAGGEGAVVALTETLNAVAQQATLQSTLAANKMIEQAVTGMKSAQDAALPDMIRTQTAKNNLAAANPIFSNPAIKPIMEAAQVQIAGKYPNATPAELTDMTQRYILAMGEAFNPTAPAANVGVPAEQDFSKFLVG